MSYFEINKFSRHIESNGTICFIGLGSNLNDPLTQIIAATKMLDLIPKTNIIRSSSIYKSKPVDGSHQPDYLNAVVKIQTQQPPVELLRVLEFFEAEHGRRYKENDPRGAPRVIDYDILLYGDEIIEHEDLIVPHKELHKRSFVVKPLEEIDPLLMLPTKKGPISIGQVIQNVDCSELELYCEVKHIKRDGTSSDQNSATSHQEVASGSGKIPTKKPTRKRRPKREAKQDPKHPDGETNG